MWAIKSWRDFLGWVTAKVPEVIGNVAWFWLDVWWKTADIVRAPFSEKTYWELQKDREKSFDLWTFLKESWKKSKKDIGSLWVYNPESWSAKAWEFATEIGSSFLMPGWLFKKGAWTFANLMKAWAEWATQGAVFDIASKWEVTPESMGIGAGANIALWWVWKTYSKAKDIFKQPTKIVDEMGEKIIPWVIFDKWNPVEIQLPDIGRAKTTIKNLLDWSMNVEATAKIGKNGVSERMRLANSALKPTYGWKTAKEKLATMPQTEEALKTLWTLQRTGKVEWSIDSLYEGAMTVQKALDDYGKVIGDEITAKGDKMIDVSDLWATAKEVVEDPVQQYAKAYWPLKDLTNAIEQGGWQMSVKNLFELKKIFSDQLWTLIKDGQMNSTAYRVLRDSVESLGNKIDEVVDSASASEAKEIYKQMKRIQKSIIDSAQVDMRRSPMNLAEQIAFMQNNPLEWVTNPVQKWLSEAWKALWDELKARTSRDGTFQQLMRIYDLEASKAYDTLNKAPKKTFSDVMSPTRKTGVWWSVGVQN